MMNELNVTAEAVFALIEVGVTVTTRVVDALVHDLARERQHQGLTQHELADRIHVSLSTVANWEQGRTTPPLTAVRAYAAALDCDLWVTRSCWKTA